MFDRWFAAVHERLAKDTSGWGLADRFECKDWKESHEGLVASALESSGFNWGDERYPSARNRRADGVIFLPQQPETKLRYEMKSVFLPHYNSSGDKHGYDYERLLRLEQPNGALHDVERLRQASESTRVFFLIAISWTDPTSPNKLSLYEQHRGVLLETFRKLANLEEPKERSLIRGREPTRPWSADLLAWAI